MKRMAAVLALLAGCSSAATDDVAGRPGNPAVYARIEATTSCPKLQREFESAMGNAERFPAGDPNRAVPLSYAEAVADRQLELGC